MKLRSKIDARSTSAGTSTDAQNASQNGSSVNRPSAIADEATGVTRACRPPLTPRVGLFLYTPRVGGAERYVKDLLHGIDRDRFEPVLVYAAWPALRQFLATEGSGIESVEVRVAELGARLRPGLPASASSTEPAATAHGVEVEPSTLRRLVNRAPRWQALAPAARSGTRAAFVARNLLLLRPQLAAARLDALHVINGGYPGATSAQAAMIAAQRLDIPARLMTVCSTAVTRTFPVAAEARIDRAVVAAAQVVVVPGATPADALVERRGFRRDRLVAIPWGVPVPDQHRTRADARAALGLPPGAVVVGTLANFTGAKGHDLLLDAFSRLAEGHPDVHLVLGGDGPFRADLQRRAANGPWADRITFPGNVADALDFCQALDVFVLASDIEGLPYVVLEAMSLSVPVIATDVGAMAEAVADGETGLLVPRRDPGALTLAMATLLDDPRRRAAMRAATRVRFDRSFDVARMVDRHHDLYSGLLAPPSR